MAHRTRRVCVRVTLALMAFAVACNLPNSVPTPAWGAAPPESTATPRSGSRPPALPAIVEWPLTVDEVLALCPAAEEIAAINSKITMSFESDPTAGRLVCTAAAGSADLTRLKKNAYNAILIMKHLEFDEPLPWTDQPLFDWFLDTIRAIRFRDDIQFHSCCGTPPTINILTELHALYSERWSAVGSLMRLYVHEARHTFKAHACEGRDRTVEEMGAMGVEYSLYQWLAYHSDAKFLTILDPGPTDDYRQAARREAYIRLKSSFCAQPTPEALPPPLTVSSWAKTPVATDRMAAAVSSGVPVPVPLSPIGEATVDPRGTRFTWEAVEFPGGVTYNIEIDAYYSFDQDWQYWEARADETGLTTSGYTMPLSFDLYQTRGRWRIWATSPAIGDGPKSEWQYFQLGPR